jgi:hypothetical protein
MAKHREILDAVYARIVSLGLSGIPAANILERKIPLDRNLDSPPYVFVCQVGNEVEYPGSIGADDFGFPVLVVMVSASNQDNAVSDTELTWREAVTNAFHNKRLPNVASVWRCVVEHATIIDPNWFRDGNLTLSQLTVRAISRRVRT